VTDSEMRRREVIIRYRMRERERRGKMGERTHIAAGVLLGVLRGLRDTV